MKMLLRSIILLNGELTMDATTARTLIIPAAVAVAPPPKRLKRRNPYAASSSKRGNTSAVSSYARIDVNVNKEEGSHFKRVAYILRFLAWRILILFSLDSPSARQAGEGRTEGNTKDGEADGSQQGGFFEMSLWETNSEGQGERNRCKETHQDHATSLEYNKLGVLRVERIGTDEYHKRPSESEASLKHGKTSGSPDGARMRRGWTEGKREAVDDREGPGGTWGDPTRCPLDRADQCVWGRTSHCASGRTACCLSRQTKRKKETECRYMTETQRRKGDEKARRQWVKQRAPDPRSNDQMARWTGYRVLKYPPSFVSARAIRQRKNGSLHFISGPVIEKRNKGKQNKIDKWT
ncbi:hypothetical protein PLEOSDRAFT_169430 [Pleurotus ostreatus PC15]|uniref:Uncharacterized protein n=1 Tax=Pleurotus ostreatus (strain PC15) TaxID=1137138 RepID=A0A067NBJ9_PLEO1|nr:hypothetical protein PLEOSDRAFT_169430 [Pleurotus ostreatus PC15]